MHKQPTLEEILANNPGIDPEVLRGFMEFHKLFGIPPITPGTPKIGRRLLVGDPDTDDARAVRLRYIR